MFSFEYTTSSKSVMGYILKIAKPNAFWMDNSFETTTLAYQSIYPNSLQRTST